MSKSHYLSIEKLFLMIDIAHLGSYCCAVPQWQTSFDMATLASLVSGAIFIEQQLPGPIVTASMEVIRNGVMKRAAEASNREAYRTY